MLKRLVLICLGSCLVSLAGPAFAEAKLSPAPAEAGKPKEVRGKIAAPETKAVEAPRRNPKWSNPALNLSHCLAHTDNMAVIRCAD